jgi:hypothetical protein
VKIHIEYDPHTVWDFPWRWRIWDSDDNVMQDGGAVNEEKAKGDAQSWINKELTRVSYTYDYPPETKE